MLSHCMESFILGHNPLILMLQEVFVGCIILSIVRVKVLCLLYKTKYCVPGCIKPRLCSVQYNLYCVECHEHEEMIQHLLSSCPALATTSYLDRHNMVCRLIHWHLCKFFKLSTSASSWYGHNPLQVVENGDEKLLWDFGQTTMWHQTGLTLCCFTSKKVE